MSSNLPLVDDAKSYLVSGEKLNALTRLSNQWANFRVEYGETLDVIRSDTNAILTIPNQSSSALLDPYPLISQGTSGFDITVTINSPANTVEYDWYALNLSNPEIYYGQRETGNINFTADDTGVIFLSVTLDGYRNYVTSIFLP